MQRRHPLKWGERQQIEVKDDFSRLTIEERMQKVAELLSPRPDDLRPGPPQLDCEGKSLFIRSWGDPPVFRPADRPISADLQSVVPQCAAQTGEGPLAAPTTFLRASQDPRSHRACHATS
jgi:hypothetical protein